MKHLNEELRIIIWDMLEKGICISQIALAVGKDRTTVMREILNHRSGVGNGECPLLAGPPHVCNGCGDMRSCRLGKWLYIPDKAQAEYRRTLVDSRTGFNLSVEELAHIGDVLAAGVSRGQSVFHVMTAHASEFTVCEKTVYSLINAGVIRVRRHHLPEAPSRPLPLKLRKSKPRQHKVDRHCRDGRTMDDFRAFIEENPSASVVEMDSVA